MRTPTNCTACRVRPGCAAADELSSRVACSARTIPHTCSLRSLFETLPGGPHAHTAAEDTGSGDVLAEPDWSPASPPHLPKPQGTTDPSVTRNKVLLTHGRQSPRSTWVHPLWAVLFSACFALSPHQTALPEALPGARSQERQPHCRDCWELAVWFSTGSSEHS